MICVSPDFFHIAFHNISYLVKFIDISLIELTRFRNLKLTMLVQGERKKKERKKS